MLIYNNNSRKQNEKSPKFAERLSTMLCLNKQVASLKLKREIRYKPEIATSDMLKVVTSSSNQIPEGVNVLLIETAISLFLTNFFLYVFFNML